MRNVFILICLTMIVGFAFARPSNNLINSLREKALDQTRAEEVWEKAIQAKGGRERINAVRNILRTEKNSSKYLSVTLTDLPAKVWSWDKTQKPIGLWGTVADVEKNVEYAVNEYSKQADKTDAANAAFFVRRQQISILLETRWLKPELLSARKEKVENRSYDVVETRIEGERNRIDFYFDEKTHLLYMLDFIDMKTGKSYQWTRYYNYTTVDGIQVPTEYNSRFVGRKTPVKIDFNVEYDETVFEKQPSIKATPNDWKKKT